MHSHLHLATDPPNAATTRRRSALITGSTSGIGLGIASACANAGYDVMLNGFGDRAAIEEARKRIEDEADVTVAYSSADLSRERDVVRLLHETQAAFGGVDLLVNNAGLFQVEVTEAIGSEDWQRMLNVNLTAAFLTIRTALPGMKSRGFGRIVNIASALALVGQFACSAYAASKHGLLGLTRCVALETAEHGITVNAICPGYVRTPLVEAEIKAMAASRGISDYDAAAEIVAAAHPTKRFVTAAEIGALVVYLASAHAASITGAALTLDGGWTAR